MTVGGCAPITRLADMPVVNGGSKTSTRLIGLPPSESAMYRRPAVSKAMAAGVANWFRVCTPAVAGQVGLPGNEVELADFQVGADGGGEAALGHIGGRVAQNPIVSGIRQPEVVLGVERDRRR